MRLPRKDSRIRKVNRPGFMVGKLFDVWFLPHGKTVGRIKLSVTTEPKLWESPMGREKLDSLVRSWFSDLSGAMCAKIQVTSRPDEHVVVEVRWC